MTRTAPAVVGVAMASLLLAACGATTSPPAAVPSPPAASSTLGMSTAPAPDAATATAALSTLRVKGRAPMTGYSRLRFGPAWPRLGGCDARNRVLLRDLTHTVLRSGGCIVQSGTLVSPYTSGVIHFLRGPESARAQIDHVIALGDAWQTGAQGWTGARRQAFANDPLELLAVDGPSNESKGDSDAASWLPPNKSFRCTYAEIQVAVKAKYDLWVTKAEHDALARVLNRC